jgi:putative copper resistance protein D
MTGWTFTPVADVTVVMAALGYFRGVRVRGVRVRVIRGRGGRPWPRWWTACFLTGLLTVVLAFDSPVGTHSQELFWMHMVQHLALITLAPALLVLGHPLRLLEEVGGRGARLVAVLRRNPTVAVLTHPLVAFVCYAAVLVGTHLTGFMPAMRTHPWLHPVEVLLYLVSGYLFALPLLAREPVRWDLPYPARLMLVLVSMTVDTFVGIVLMLTSPQVYLGGAIMWFGGDGLMMVIALVIAGQWG